MQGDYYAARRARMNDRSDIALRIVAVVLCSALLMMLISVCRPQPHVVGRTELAAAKAYAATLPAAVTRFITSELSGEHAWEELRTVRVGRYRKAWTQGDIEIIVISNFFGMSPGERLSRLQDQGLRPQTVTHLLDAPFEGAGCLVRRYEEYGWSHGGFVLVDPASGSLSSDEVTKCVLAGFDHLLGVPIANTFDFHTFPSSSVSAVLLDYLRQCSYEGKSDVLPMQTSRHGITTFPSLSCIQEEIDAALVSNQRGD